MPELARQSTATPSPPARYPYTGWETACVFRETFLSWLTPPGAADAFRVVGNLVFDLMLNADDWPAPAESPVRRELRASASDLRFIQGWLATALEANASEMHPEDAYLASVAGRLAPQVGRIAATIERALGDDGRPS
jgi:hypothetical protein